MLKNRLLSLSICTVASLAIFQAAYAQTSAFKITAIDAAATDLFGNSVSIDGDYAVVGAFLHDDNGSNSGSAYVFTWNGTIWMQQDKLLALNGTADDKFGQSVSISGDYAVAGANFDDDNGTDAGSAYVFTHTGTSWMQQAKLLPSDGTGFAWFGYSVSISGDYTVVGASQDNDNGTNSGSAYVFHRTGVSWVEEAKLLPSNGAANDRFGASVSIDGDYAVVGAYWHDDNGTDAGSAYVFKRTGTSWAEEAKLLPSDGAAEDFFGASVSISGDYIIVGAELNDDNGSNSGSAYLFKRTGTSWAQQDKLLPSDGAMDDNFGQSVSISGDYAVVGASSNNDNGNNSGSAYLFKRTGTSWAEVTKLLAFDAAADDRFGISVSISGDCTIVGALSDDDDGSESGSAYVFCGFTTPVGDVHEVTGLPTEFTLSQNYPNPFNPETVIEYTLPVRSDVKLTIYNLRGEEVALLINGTVPAGNHRVSWDASGFASGVYIYKLIAGDFVQTKKMLLLK